MPGPPMPLAVSPSKRATGSVEGLGSASVAKKKRRVETKPSSPSAERISRALRTQQLPTNKEMSSFRTLPLAVS